MRIRARRAALETALARRNLTKSYVSELERDHRTPRLTTLKILARRLKRPLSYFLDGVTEDREPEAFLTIGRAYLRSESFAEAADWLNRAIDAAAVTGDELLQARTDLVLAEVEQRRGHHLHVWRRAERVLRTLARDGDRQAASRPYMPRPQQTCGRRSDLGRMDVRGGVAVAHSSRGRSDVGGHVALLSWSCTRTDGPDYRGRRGFPERAPGRRALRGPAARGRLAHRSRRRGGRGRVFRRRDRACRGSNCHLRHVAAQAQARGDSLAVGRPRSPAERWTEAQRHYSASIAIYGAARHVWGAARTLASFVDAVHARLRPDVMRAIGEIVLALFPADDGATPGTTDDDRAGTLWLRGTIQRLLGQTNEARASLIESLRLFERLRRLNETTTIRRELALLAVESNDLVAA